MSPYYLERRIPNKIGTRNGLLYEVISIHDKRHQAAQKLRRLEQQIPKRPKYRIMFHETACSECGEDYKLDHLGLCLNCIDFLRDDYNDAYARQESGLRISNI